MSRLSAQDIVTDIMAARAAYLPLFAKAQVVLGLFSPLLLLVLYPERKREAEAYQRAPVCAEHATDVTACRRIAVAEVVRVECPRKYEGLESCQLELRLDGHKTFIQLLREVSNRFGPGSQLRVEVFGNDPTAAEVDGKLVREYGSPETAMESIVEAVELQAVLTAAAVFYLVRRRRRLANGESVD